MRKEDGGGGRAADARQAIREMWRVEFTRAPLEHAERLAETFALAWGEEEVAPEEKLRAAVRDLAYARSYALHIESGETGNSLRRGECFYIVAAGRIATELGALLPKERIRPGRWREVGLREVFLPELAAPYRKTLERAVELLHDRSIEEASAVRRGVAAVHRDERPSVIGGMLEALGGELRVLSEYLKSLFLPEAARLSIEIERLAVSAIRGAKERCDA